MPLTYLRTKREMDFWNLVYYFNEYLLPFDFILPYESEKQAKVFDLYRKE